MILQGPTLRALERAEGGSPRKRLIAIVVVGVLALNVVIGRFAGGFFYDLFWAFLEQHHVRQADVIAYTLTHLASFLLARLIVAPLFLPVRYELSRDGKARATTKVALRGGDMREIHEQHDLATAIREQIFELARQEAARRQQVLEMEAGETGPFFKTEGTLYAIKRAFNVKLSNIHPHLYPRAHLNYRLRRWLTAAAHKGGIHEIAGKCAARYRDCFNHRVGGGAGVCARRLRSEPASQQRDRPLHLGRAESGLVHQAHWSCRRSWAQRDDDLHQVIPRGLRSAQLTRHFVTAGLDPVVHAKQPNALHRRMNCRVKPGNDALCRCRNSKTSALSAP